MELLTRQPLHGESARYCLLLELLSQGVYKSVIPITPLSMRCRREALRPIGRAVSCYKLGIFLSTEGSQCGAFFIVLESRRCQIIRRHLPESEVESRTMTEDQYKIKIKRRAAYPRILYALSGAICLTSSKSAANSGSQGLYAIDQDTSLRKSS